MQHDKEELNEKEDALKKSNMGQLLTRVHDSLSDCEPFHQCSADFDAILGAVQEFFKERAQRDGKRVAALELFASSCTMVAAGILENVKAMKDEPLEGDPPIGGATVAFLWEAMLQDVTRIIRSMSDGAITVMIQGENVYSYSEGKPH